MIQDGIRDSGTTEEKSQKDVLKNDCGKASDKLPFHPTNP